MTLADILESSKENTEVQISTPTHVTKTGMQTLRICLVSVNIVVFQAGFDFGGDTPSTLKLKFELSQKTLQDEVSLRKEVEEKVNHLEEVCDIFGCGLLASCFTKGLLCCSSSCCLL